MLEAFGVSSAAEKLYLHLLREPDLRIEAISGELGWPEDEVRAALDELSGLALLRTSPAHPRTLRPVAPDVGLESLLTTLQADLVARQHQMESGRAALAMLTAEYADLHRRGDRTVTEELVGVEEVRTRLKTLSAQAQTEVIALVPDPIQRPDTLAASKPLDAALLGRGVAMRTIYLNSIRNDPASIAYTDWLAGVGGQVRTAPTVPLRLIVFDRTTALVPLDPRDTSAGATVLTGIGVVSAMCALFEQIWATANPLGLPNPPDTQGLGPEEREILRMLANGETDEHIARRLGVSTRTVGRKASELMRRLGTRSRFQMGVRASELGWLDPPQEPLDDDLDGSACLRPAVRAVESRYCDHPVGLRHY
ncbi:transcriptional regulator, LuxR family [Catenulispora acidiphila DSM 44928]|uniref:Transcriptional regulator, LuxR family n=1 Tax=Catenulispora acidiphila (strain DSM 44928 / JCM 14897 / NBRC 102108 / NRRL B-24433 / ID139908) TaxID=479433 RepID=C7Q8S9_CATAD|nr:helix-turn-helix transcriptional regulator [Catenulispora acidiphila]ACU70344.1 transcriptional regulator, LuxR family [Catenulispora acidiphila DSM 44928]